MDVNPNNIETGMDVFSSDGEKIGSITDIFHETPSSTTSAGYGQASEVVVEEVDVTETIPANVPSGVMGSGTDTTSAGAAGGTTWNPSMTTDQNVSPGYTPTSGMTGTSGTTASGYIKVQEGGVLGIGAKHLYIPFSAIQDIDPSNCVSLNVTKQEANDMYMTKPDWIADTT